MKRVAAEELRAGFEFKPASEAERPRHKGLVACGLLAVPACALMALAWVGQPPGHSARFDAPARLGPAQPPGFVAAATASPFEGEEAPVLATRFPGAPSATGDAELDRHDGAPASTALAGDDAEPAPSSSDEEDPVLAAQVEAVPLPAADGPPPSFAEEEPTFAAGDPDAQSTMASDGPGTSVEPAPPAFAPSFAEGEPGLGPVEGNGSAVATRDEGDPAPHDATAVAEAVEPAVGDAPVSEPVARAEIEDAAPPEAAPPASPAVADAAEPRPEAEAAHVPVAALSLSKEAAPADGAGPAVTAAGDDPPEAAQDSAAARPGAPADAAPETAAPTVIAATGMGVAAMAAPEFPGGSGAVPPHGRVAALAPPPKPRSGWPPHQPSAPRASARDAQPPPDTRCRAIVLKAQLGEETSHAERSFLRSGCGARR